MCSTIPKGTFSGGGKDVDEIVSPATKSSQRGGGGDDSRFSKFLSGFKSGGGMNMFEPQIMQSQFMPQMLNDPLDPGAGPITQSLLAQLFAQSGY